MSKRTIKPKKPKKKFNQLEKRIVDCILDGKELDDIVKELNLENEKAIEALLRLYKKLKYRFAEK
jgi:hypothetical protein